MVANFCFGQVKISGRVSDVNGENLPGVNVLLKGTRTGTITDLDGKYSISLESGEGVLLFSYVGYLLQEVTLSGQNQIDVVLEESAEILDELVVVGYGTQKKSLLTAAISQIGSEALEDRPLLRLEQSIQGQTAGVQVTLNSGQPGAGARVRIRGTGSFGTRQNPLYIVDGILYNNEGSLDFLNQNDIASIEVLKDAASAAIYGAQGGNGVVIVTTKSGKKGELKISYDSYFGMQNTAKKLDLLNTQQYVEILNEAAENASQPAVFPSTTDFNSLPNTDWQDAVFANNAPISNHQLSISGGSEKSTHFFSLSYYQQDGIVAPERSNLKRFTARLNSDYSIKNWLKVGHKLSFTNIVNRGVTENSEFGSPLGRAINIDPTTPVYETNPTRLAELENIVSGSDTIRFELVSDENGTFGVSDVGSEIVNPVAALAIQNGENWARKINNNVYAQINFFEGFSFRSDFSSEVSFWGDHSYTPVHYLNATNNVGINTAGPTEVRLNTSFQSVNQIFNWNSDNIITYSKSIGEHKFTVTAGAIIQAGTGVISLSGSRQDFDEIPGQTNIDAARNIESDRSAGSFENESISRFSLLGRINYDFKEKYLASVSFRRDASSAFGANNRFAYFPAVSAGWVISKENFFNAGVIDFLKLRASWGVNGIDSDQTLQFSSVIENGFSGALATSLGSNETLFRGALPEFLANPDLKWEEARQLDIGIDLRLFNSSFNIALDYYNKTNADLIVNGSLGGGLTLGNELAIFNLGDMKNEGIDIELGYVGKIGENFNYDVSGNLSYLKNTVLNIGGDAAELIDGRFGPQGVEILRTIEGLPLAHIFGFVTDGIFQNSAELQAHVNAEGQALQPAAQAGDVRFVDVNQDGIIDDDDRTMIGDPTPNWSYGMTINLSYKNFDLSILGQGIAGNDIFRAYRRFDLPRSNYTADILKRWTGAGTSNRLPRVTFNDTNGNFTKSSDLYIEKGNFFRIRNLQIGYKLPQSLLAKINVTKARIYISANNLLTLTQYSGFDPELVGGVDRGNYPQARTFLFGFNITL